MWSGFVVKPSESWRFDSPEACNLPHEDAADRSSNLLSACSSLLCSLPRGLKEHILLHLQLLGGASAGCCAGGFCALDPCTLRVALKIPMQQKLNSSQPALNPVLLTWAGFLIIPKSSHLQVFVSGSFLSRLPVPATSTPAPWCVADLPQ